MPLKFPVTFRNLREISGSCLIILHRLRVMCWTILVPQPPENNFPKILNANSNRNGWDGMGWIMSYLLHWNGGPFRKGASWLKIGQNNSFFRFQWYLKNPHFPLLTLPLTDTSQAWIWSTTLGSFFVSVTWKTTNFSTRPTTTTKYTSEVQMSIGACRVRRLNSLASTLL